MTASSPHNHNPALQDVVVAASLKRPIMPGIRWGAVLAGVAVGISVQLALTLLGLATGLSSTEVTRGETLGAGPLIWAGFSMMVAAFVGGYVAARMSGLKRKADGVLHGAVAWAVTTILFALLATTIGGTLMSGIFTNMGQLPGAAAKGGESPLAAIVRGQIGNMDAESLRRFQEWIQAGQREQAIEQLTTTMGVEPERAANLVDQALIMSGAPASASAQSRAQTESAMDSAGMAAWAVFIAVSLGLVLGIAGGALGARGARRVSWSTPHQHMPAS